MSPRSNSVMKRERTQRTCRRGHRYWKSSDCPTCPVCEAQRAPSEGWMSALGAPARRALEREELTRIEVLAERTEKELLALHGIGPSSLPVIRAAMRSLKSKSNTNDQEHMRNTTKKPTNTDEYIGQLPADQQSALQKLRSQIVAAAPSAAEHFGYGLPGFKYNGHPLVYFGAAKEHCALYGAVPAGFAERLKDFEVSKGTIRFTPKKPLPATLMKAIVKARMAENDARWAPKKAASTKTAKKK